VEGLAEYHSNFQDSDLLTPTATFAQELLSTFSTSLGEVALQPSTGGTFVVKLYHAPPSADGGPASIQEHLLWDRKAEGGFPGPLIDLFPQYVPVPSKQCSSPWPRAIYLYLYLYPPTPHLTTRATLTLRQKRRSSKSASGTSSIPRAIWGT
jgi:predicted Rdx family selenoprotein